MADLMYRTLVFNDYKVKFIMNMTDVGHLASDADEGADRLEAAAEKEGKSAKDIAEFYIEDFLQSYNKLNLTHPLKFTRATEYIQEQINLVKVLEDKGFTYRTSDGIYFDTSKFPEYGKLSGLTADNIKEGARVEVNPEKKHPNDFALWKFSPSDKKRWQEWESPWGIGFPGWHIECSAMSLVELGQPIDIHMGGEDLKMTHHPNEIAQSECATGKPFVRYWVHSAFLTVDGGKMSKSLNNFYTVKDIIAKGFDPLALRYFYMTAHYRNQINFTWEALQSAHNSLKKIRELVSSYKEDSKVKPSEKYIERFTDKINDDLNFPEALAVVWEMLKNSISEPQKIATILKMDEVLGFKLDESLNIQIPVEVVNLAKMRVEYRKGGIWDKADVLRRQISDLGYIVEDVPGGTYKLKRK
jgi:cysteinyl-tRNA synthetase